MTVQYKHSGAVTGLWGGGREEREDREVDNTGWGLGGKGVDISTETEREIERVRRGEETGVHTGNKKHGVWKVKTAGSRRGGMTSVESHRYLYVSTKTLSGGNAPNTHTTGTDFQPALQERGLVSTTQ